jgi:hypothetical protein
MLQNLSAEVVYCLERAEDCAKRARCEINPALRRDFFDMEQRWLKLARSYEFAEQLQRFASHNKQQRGEVTQRLEELKRKVDGHQSHGRLALSIARFVQIPDVFDPEVTLILGKAFDMACAELGRTPQPTAVRVAIAAIIVEAAKLGERNPHRLRDAGLTAVGQKNSAK